LTSFDRHPPRQRIILMLIVILILGFWALGLTHFDRRLPGAPVSDPARWQFRTPASALGLTNLDRRFHAPISPHPADKRLPPAGEDLRFFRRPPAAKLPAHPNFKPREYAFLLPSTGRRPGCGVVKPSAGPDFQAVFPEH
jgi:hypothetical protein